MAGNCGGNSRETASRAYAYRHRAEYTAELPIQRMVRTERWKLIYYSHLRRYQLFDLVADPHELPDLSADSNHAAVMAEMRHKMDAWLQARMAPYAGIAPGRRGAAKR